MSGMLTSLIGEWIRSDFEETPEQFSQIAVYMTKELPKSLVAKYEKKTSHLASLFIIYLSCF
ncbi:hypothetical protein LQK80_08835 [Bacillus thuringiensis]|nr:hypothetical protein [Bacillus thuringiensis]